MAVGDVYRLSVQNINRNSFNELVNVFHYRLEADLPLTHTGAEDLIIAWDALVKGPYKGPMSANTDVTKLEVRQVTGGTEYAELALTPPEPGSQGGDIMAQQTCPIITWRTGQAGRSFRGRTYLPATSELVLSNGFFAPSFVTVMNDFGSAAMHLPSATPNYGEWQMVIWSRTLSVGTPVTSFTSRNIPATQRSRRIGVGS